MDKIPDFTNLKNILLCREGKYVPICELLVEDAIKEKIISRPVTGIRDEIDFCLQSGYDFLGISSGILKPTLTLAQMAGKNTDRWAEENRGDIYSDRTFEEYPWPDPEKLDYSSYIKASSIMPENMKIIGIGGKIFTASWMLMGFNNFSTSIYDDYDLVKKVLNRVGEIQFEVFRKVINQPSVEGYWVVDDIAYSEGLILSRKILDDNVFPWYRKMGEICRKREIPFIFHSDGNLLEVMDTLLECGFTALHPIEPKAMDIRKLHFKYRDRICFLGNIELDTLIRGAPGDIRDLVINNLKDIAPDGFYAAGSSNSVTKAVPVENYLSMNDTTLRYGRYPISL
jgi:uroporphyrinogen decarboxylase